MRAARFTLHVPEQRNDGTSVTDAEWFAIERDLLEISDGFTLTQGVGAWQSSDGTIYREDVRLYAVDSKTPESAGQRMLSLADFVAHALDQEAVYLTRAELATELVEPRPVLA